MVSPARASTSWRSSVKLKGFAAPLVLMVEPLAPSPCPERFCKIVRKILQHALKRIWGALPETADRGIAHRGRHLLEQALDPGSVRHQLHASSPPHPPRLPLPSP